jgi:Leucine-rich repeat (LRR) protein
MWLRLILATLFISISGPARSLPPLKQAPELPAELIKQFEALGFQYGHFVVDQDEELRFETPSDRAPGEKPRAGSVPGFASAEIDDATLAKIPRTDKAFGLALHSSNVTGEGLVHLAHCPRLSILDLSFCDAIDNSAIANLPPLHELASLNLYGLPLSDAGLKALSNQERLQRLSIARMAVTDEGIKELGRLRALRALDVSSCKKITGAGLKQLADGNAGLQVLLLGFCGGLSDGGPGFFSRLSDLQHLNLTWTNVSDDQLADISRLKRLRVLVLKDCRQISEAGLKRLAMCRSLEDLTLEGIPSVTDAVLKELAALPKLRALDLHSCEGFMGAGLRELNRLPELRYLNLSRCKQLVGRDFAGLAGTKSLKTLELSFTRVSDVKSLAEIKSLAKLDLSATDLGDDALRDFAALEGLRELVLIGCERITNAGLTEIARLKGLQELNLSSCPNFGEHGIRALAESSHLQRLALIDCPGMSDAAVGHLANLKSLRQLSIIDCKLVTEPAIDALRKALPDCHIEYGSTGFAGVFRGLNRSAQEQEAQAEEEPDPAAWEVMIRRIVLIAGGVAIASALIWFLVSNIKRRRLSAGN